MKICARCKNEKPANREHFSPLKKAKDGLHSWCKSCLAAWRRDDRIKRPDHYSLLEKRRHERHGEKRRAANRKLWAKNSIAYSLTARVRYQERGELYNAARRAKFSANPTLRAERAAQNRAWLDANKDRVSEARRVAWLSATPTQKLRTYFGAAIAHSLRNNGKGGRSWQQLVGYTADELKIHIERQFTAGMKWSNYGEWHIDHIIPASSFLYSTPDDPEFLACWSLANLRPLWAVENIRKRDQRVYLL